MAAINIVHAHCEAWEPPIGPYAHFFTAFTCPTVTEVFVTREDLLEMQGRLTDDWTQRAIAAALRQL